MNSLAPQELSRLHRFVLGHPDRFSLAIVRASQLGVREEVIQWTRELAGALSRPFRLLQGTNLSPDEIGQELSTGSTPGTIQILTGVDQHLADVDKGLARILNLQRERIAELVPGPMLLMIGELAFNRLLQDAPDFADWHAASFTFTRETTESGHMIHSDSAGSQISQFSRGLIESRIALLEGQLSQPRSGLHRAKVLIELAQLHGNWVSAFPGGRISSLTVQQSLEAANTGAEQAVNLFREHTGSESDLANALLIQGNMLSELGRREESLEAAGEAVDIYRQLAQSRPDSFLPDLAGSLNNYGNRLSGLGRREEALTATGEAVDIHRQLTQSKPEAFLPDLAKSLNNYGNRLGQLRRLEEALTAAGESVALYRQLSQNRPDAFLTDLARSLNNYGNKLGELGKREEALTAAGESVAIRRQLAQSRPDAFLPDFASSLSNYGNRLSALGRREEALAATGEAVGICRQLAQSRPEVFLPKLAISLAALGSATEDPKSAAALFHEGARTLLPLFLKSPHAQAPLISKLLQAYIKACEQTSSDADPDLLEQVFQVFQQMQNEAKD